MTRSAERASDESVMQVRPSGRYLLDADGKPFFWPGDTAWLLVSS